MTPLTQLGGLAAALAMFQETQGSGGVWAAFFEAHAAQLGSYFLLLALMLALYSFLAGVLALFGRDPLSERIGETARRAGIAIFFLVILAAITLVTAAFQDYVSTTWNLDFSQCELPVASKLATR